MNQLKHLIENGLVSYVPDHAWRAIHLTNLFATIAILVLFAYSIPSPNLSIDNVMTCLVLFALILVFSIVSMHLRFNELTKKMVEIDAENDIRDNENFAHTELVLHEVQYLVRKSLEINSINSKGD